MCVIITPTHQIISVNCRGIITARACFIIMRKGFIRISATTLLFLYAANGLAQQFIGLNTTAYAAIHHMPTNPAWVNNSANGTEIMLFSANGLAGTNAYYFYKKFILNGFNGQAVEGQDYLRDPQIYQKHLWANLEINGPAVSFTYKKQHHIGAFTRARQLHRGGNITSGEFRLLGQEPPETYYDNPVPFTKAGYSTHSFAEVGITYGRILRNDYYNVLKGGVSVKYLMGFVAGSVYTNELNYTHRRDSIGIEGDINLLYTHNIGPYIDNNAQNDLTSWFQRAGRSGLGMDIGVQYEYHPDGNPNVPTPYLFSIAASITDMGGISYIADTGSGRYELDIYADTGQLVKFSYEGINEYMMKLERDTLLPRGEQVAKFRMGLPTAFRLNADYNAGNRINFALNMLLNLRGNGGDRYRPAYVSYINVTPSYGGKNFQAGIPFTIIGYQTFAIGATLRFGPFYIGSSSALTTIMSRKIKNIDGYAGLVWKFRKEERRY